MEPQTLLEYLTFVKGVGYLLVVAYLFAFLTFWQLIHIKEKEVVRVVSVIVIMWLTFGVTSALVMNGNARAEVTSSVPEVTSSSSGTLFPEYYGNGTPATSAAHNTKKWLRVNTSGYLPTNYSTTVDFHRIMGNKVSCITCHHHSGDEIHACKDCHGTPFNPDNMNTPGIKAAIHQRCRECHNKEFSGPDSCKLCHITGATEAPESMVTSHPAIPVTTATVGAHQYKSMVTSPPAIPHQLTWGNCNGCHKKGVNGAPLVPADHTGRTVDTCSGCHMPDGGN